MARQPRTERERHRPTKTEGGYTVGIHEPGGSRYPMDFTKISEAREFARDALHGRIDSAPPPAGSRVTIHPNAWKKGGVRNDKVEPPVETHWRKGERESRSRTESFGQQ